VTIEAFTESGNSPPAKPSKAHVKTYFILNPDTRRVKIGKSIDPDSRIRDLQCAAGAKLILLGVLGGDRERDFHRKFHEHRVQGEWFNLAPPLEQFVCSQFKCGRPGGGPALPETVRTPKPKPKLIFMSKPNLAHDIEAVTGLPLHERDEDLDPKDEWTQPDQRLQDYLDDVLTGPLHDEDFSNEPDAQERLTKAEHEEYVKDEIERYDEHMGWIYYLLKPWWHAFIGWSAPDEPGQWVDLWLVYWAPPGAATLKKFYEAIEAVYAQTEDLGPEATVDRIRLHVALVDRKTFAVTAVDWRNNGEHTWDPEKKAWLQRMWDQHTPEERVRYERLRPRWVVNDPQIPLFEV